jgi:hypothetical protein
MIDTARPQICTAALWDRCRCPKCHSDPGATGPAPDAAARSILPHAAGGGTPSPSSALRYDPARLDKPAADRNPSLSDAPIGGLSLQERDA